MLRERCRRPGIGHVGAPRWLQIGLKRPSRCYEPASIQEMGCSLPFAAGSGRATGSGMQPSMISVTAARMIAFWLIAAARLRRLVARRSWQGPRARRRTRWGRGRRLVGAVTGPPYCSLFLCRRLSGHLQQGILRPSARSPAVTVGLSGAAFGLNYCSRTLAACQSVPR